ncbi:SAM-dependent methyltransferase [Enterocloster aldenensis]|uniref:class I SAM-dependent methyltransferase n=1 Tax=Enterocloster aldenensis TaxID=358742 RepID=UPI000E5240CC|nr:SAM-dependent methyltransferase [Enterocloster aldenensis]
MDQEESRELGQALDLFLDEALERILFSNPVDRERIARSRLRPLLMKGSLVFQAEEQVGRQAFHRNMSKEETVSYITELLDGSFRQAEIVSGRGTGLILVSRKGKVTVKVKQKAHSGGAGEQPARMQPASGLMSHNRQKSYILKEGCPVRFLVDLGVMTKDGRIVNSRYDKYRQINRFLEFIEDILPNLNQEEETTIIDFGCGKSYLTFAMYHYLKVMKEYPVRIIGLDLKQDVIDHCSRLARQYGYDGLDFYHGDIASYEGVDHVDMVVTLHACDTATDFALKKAVDWGAKVILSVPCCQHELAKQISCDIQKPVLQYGLIKERMAALYTDAIRAQVLERCGYRTQILEFIDMEHTPKNILIRGIRQDRKAANEGQLKELLGFLGITPAAVRLLAPELCTDET